MQSEKSLSNILDGIEAILWDADFDSGLCTYVNAHAENLGYPLQCWFETPNFWSTIVVPDDLKTIVANAQREIAAGFDQQLEYRILTADGEMLWVHHNISLINATEQTGKRICGVILNITKPQRTENELSHHVSLDELTGLPTRLLLQERMNWAIAHARRNNQILAVFLIDFDRFKLINDSYGYDIGDMLLQSATTRFNCELRETDIFARLTADEFVLVSNGLTKMEDAVVIAQKILDTLSLPFSIENYTFFLTASIGICVYPKDGISSVELLKHAETAMYRAKDQGKSRYVFYTEEMNVAIAQRLNMENQLRLALERQEFVLHYQAQADLETGQIIGVEALVRWQHPDLGLIPPDMFIKIAEETSLILPLGEWVLNEACRQISDWQQAGLPRLRMGVNLSACQFNQPGLIDTVNKAFSKAIIEPKQLDLEITESLLMHDMDEALETMQTLRRIGTSLSVDDFGTGYSSLSYLSRFPVTTVKIDRSFVQDVTTNPNMAALVRSIISMAHELRLRVIAEGVETEGQLNYLVNNHCDEIQGYYLSKPITADAFVTLFHQFTRLDCRRGGSERWERTLLMVDDEVNIVNSLKRQFRSNGYRILTATSAKEGLEILANHAVGVIISDQRMPEMTGVEFFRCVKELYPATVRIVLSGYSDFQSITDAINQGAIYKFLSKPWDDALLQDTVREAFQRYELTQENARLGRALEFANHELSHINQNLERRVAEKTLEINRSIKMLQVSQQVLEYLPVAVIGIDDDGLIVIANRKADALFSDVGCTPLLSCNAVDRLPDELLYSLRDLQSSDRIVKLFNGRVLEVRCYDMRDVTHSKGTIAVILQTEA